MTSIKDILTNHEVTPSPRSWEKLCGRLDVMMPQSSAPAQAPAPTGTSHILGTLGAKIATAFVGIATVTAVITAVVLNTRKGQEPQQQTVVSSERDVFVADTQATTPVQATAIEQITAPVYTPDARTPVVMSAANPADEATYEIEPVSTPDIAGTTVPAMVNVPVSAPVAPKVQANPAQPMHHDERPSVAQTVQQDPVVQALPDDAIDWNPPIKIEIPNVFTPNGDGYNDYFVVLGLENCTQRELEVYNRAGQRVFYSQNYENNWNGGDCPDGMYSYRLHFAGYNGIEQTMSGTVHIIRR